MILPAASLGAAAAGAPLLAMVEAAWRSLLTGSEESEGC